MIWVLLKCGRRGTGTTKNEMKTHQTLFPSSARHKPGGHAWIQTQDGEEASAGQAEGLTFPPAAGTPFANWSFLNKKMRRSFNGRMGTFSVRQATAPHRAFISSRQQRRVQRTESRLKGEEAALFPPQRPLNAAPDGRSECRVFWGITATSGWTTRKQMSFSGANLTV